MAMAASSRAGKCTKPNTEAYGAYGIANVIVSRRRPLPQPNSPAPTQARWIKEVRARVAGTVTLLDTMKMN